MRNLHIKALAALCAVAFAGGCGSLKQTTRAQPAVVPLSKITNSASVVDPDYQIGRSYHDRRQYEAAIAAYRRSLELNPGNAEAHNALGVIYATLGRHEQAVTELMAALAIAPSAAHIHNNLGFAYLSRGLNLDAAAALRVATELDPVNRRSRENLRTAERTLAQGLQQSDVELGDPVDAIIKSPLAEKGADPSLSQLVGVAPNIFELRQSSPVQPKPAAMPLARIHDVEVRLEIANGSGVTGLAKRTSSSLQVRGYTVLRITNQTPYKQEVTEIQYRRGDESRANQLAALLLQPAKLVETDRLTPVIGIRLLLGRDIGQEMLFGQNSAADAARKAEYTPGRG